jgi:hypothetical protein
MTKLAFEQIEDVNVDRPYLFVFLLEDDETYWVGQFHQFLYISIGDDDRLSFTFYPSENPILLTHTQWAEILETAEIFLDKTLKRDDS